MVDTISLLPLPYPYPHTPRASTEPVEHACPCRRHLVWKGACALTQARDFLLVSAFFVLFSRNPHSRAIPPPRSISHPPLPPHPPPAPLVAAESQIHIFQRKSKKSKQKKQKESSSLNVLAPATMPLPLPTPPPIPVPLAKVEMASRSRSQPAFFYSNTCIIPHLHPPPHPSLGLSLNSHPLSSFPLYP